MAEDNTGDDNTGDDNTGDEISTSLVNDDQTPADGKTDDDGKTLVTDKPPENAPEKYEDFTLADDVPMDETALKGFHELAREANMTQAMAQKFVDYEAKMRTEATEEVVKQWTDKVAEWRTSVKSDSELGGPAYETTITNAKVFLKEFGTPELSAALNETGMGNHPELIRAFARAGAKMGEDQLTTGNKSSTVAKSPEEIMYPDQGKT